jgi:SAM-dependent methyltransferase
VTDTNGLKPGDPHYRAYVGPYDEYDFMGATQFRLLCALGLRASHRLLDFGCGSLRAGRFFITYLDAGNYFGIEPNRWLIEEAIEQQVGRDLIRLKQPRFDHNDRFETAVFDGDFDFVVAQSIFSHTGPDLVRKGLAGFRAVLAPSGLIAATFRHGDTDCDGAGWYYPDRPDNRWVAYRPETIRRFAADAGLYARPIPWYHPRQHWYLLAQDEARLPAPSVLHHLTGAVLFDPAFADSV